ncbi:MAG: class I SAM-dependent methyltransferase [Nitrospirota bacterium]
MTKSFDIRLRERSYYQSPEEAQKFDRRSLSILNIQRYKHISLDIEKYLRKGLVLDIGCGTARMLIEIAKNIPALNFVGIDVSDPMIKLGLRNIEAEGLSKRVKLKVCAAENLTLFQDETFDLIMSHGSLSGWLNTDETLSQIYRILKTGNFAYISDWNHNAPFGSFASYIRSSFHDSEFRERISMAFEASYTCHEFKKMISKTSFVSFDFTTEDIWMTAVLKKWCYFYF